jgi:hypothetical protein
MRQAKYKSRSFAPLTHDRVAITGPKRAPLRMTPSRCGAISGLRIQTWGTPFLVGGESVWRARNERGDQCAMKAASSGT